MESRLIAMATRGSGPRGVEPWLRVIQRSRADQGAHFACFAEMYRSTRRTPRTSRARRDRRGMGMPPRLGEQGVPLFRSSHNLVGAEAEQGGRRA